MSKSDRQLGMSRDITRRDFIHGTGLAALKHKDFDTGEDLGEEYDPESPPGKAPHEIARKPFGSITFADAYAMTEVAIDEEELSIVVDQTWRHLPRKVTA